MFKKFGLSNIRVLLLCGCCWMLLDRLAREIKVFDFVFNETVIVKKCCATLGALRYVSISIERFDWT